MGYITNTEFEYVWPPAEKCSTCWSYVDETYAEWEENYDKEDTRLNREIRRNKDNAEKKKQYEDELKALEKEYETRKERMPRFPNCGMLNKVFLDEDNDSKQQWLYRFETEMFRWRVCSHLF